MRFADFFQVDYINSNNRIKKINFDKLKNGLLYWEDLHDDKQLGFKGKSSSFFFGKKGDRYVSRPRFEIYPKNKSANLICDYDFKFFLWPISIVLNNIFNGYATYEFTKEQWNNILNEAEKILNFTKFDELFDYLINKNFIYHRTGKYYFLGKLNYFGVKFWNNKKKYITQVDDLRRWSELVLANCDSIVVQGY